MAIPAMESVTKEAIALLIDLAQRGELDPWDVQVIDVVDRFLSRLIPDERRDLHESGQAFVYAAMLVLLKANSLSEPPVVEAEDVWEELPGEEVAPLPLRLESQIRRRPVPPPPKARRITLAELITQIEAIAALVERKTPKIRPRPKQSATSRKQAMQAIAQLAHKENLTEVALALETYLGQLKTPDIQLRELAAAFDDSVGVFWALLLLSAQSKVELVQNSFYGQIRVIPLIRTAAEVS
jgi:segregation and condensation protein A